MELCVCVGYLHAKAAKQKIANIIFTALQQVTRCKNWLVCENVKNKLHYKHVSAVNSKVKNNDSPTMIQFTYLTK